MWQQLAIAVVVPLAVIYVIWTLLPAARRRRLRERLHIAPPASAAAGSLADDGCGRCAIRDEHRRPEQH